MVSAPSVSKEVFQAAVTLVQNMPKDGKIDFHLITILLDTLLCFVVKVKVYCLLLLLFV